MLACYDTGLTYNTINTIQSALSSFIVIDGHPVEQHYLMTKFMKAVFHNRPYIPKTLVIWDVDIVLRYLTTLSHKLPISVSKKKLLLLMALLAGVCGQLMSRT